MSKHFYMSDVVLLVVVLVNEYAGSHRVILSLAPLFCSLLFLMLANICGSIAYRHRRVGALGMLYFFILAHQADFDVKWCRGTTGEMIFKPWVQRIEENGAKVLVEK